MQQHEHHRAMTADLEAKARAAGLTGLADAAAQHLKHSHEATAAHQSGDVKQKASATATLLRSGADMLDQAAAAPSLPTEVLAAGNDAVKALGEGIAASV